MPEQDATPANSDEILAATPTTGITGAISVSVTTGTSGNTYNLAVGIPTSTGGAYSFALTETAPGSTTPATLADFAFVDSNNFKIDVDMPPLKGPDGLAITAGFHLADGSVPTSAAV